MNNVSQKGFSLIELMIVVALIGILSAWAIPNYRDHVATSKLAEAHEALTNYRSQMEQYMQDNRSYRNGTNCGVVAPTTPKFFTLSCAAASDEEYILTATAKTDSGVSGFVFTVNQVNARATTGVPSGASAQATCWSTKRNGLC